MTPTRPVFRHAKPVQSAWTHVLKGSVVTPCGIDVTYMPVRIALDDEVPSCRRCRNWSGKDLP